MEVDTPLADRSLTVALLLLKSYYMLVRVWE